MEKEGIPKTYCYFRCGFASGPSDWRRYLYGSFGACSHGSPDNRDKKELVWGKRKAIFGKNVDFFRNFVFDRDFGIGSSIWRPAAMEGQYTQLSGNA